MELASAEAEAQEEKELAPSVLCASVAQQELQKLLLGGIQIRANSRASGSPAAWWPKLLSYSEPQQALYLRPASKQGNASERSRRVTRVRLASIQEVRRVDSLQLKLTCTHGECAAPAAPVAQRVQRWVRRRVRRRVRWWLRRRVRWMTCLPLPNRHLWQLPDAALCTRVAALLGPISRPISRPISAISAISGLSSTISAHGDASPRAPRSPRSRSTSLRLKLTSPRVSGGAATDRSLSLPLGSKLCRRTQPRTPAGKVETEIVSRSPRCYELEPGKVFSEKVGALVFSKLSRGGAAAQKVPPAQVAEVARVAPAAEVTAA